MLDIGRKRKVGTEENKVKITNMAAPPAVGQKKKADRRRVFMGGK